MVLPNWPEDDWRAAGRRPELSGIIHTSCGTNKQIGPRRPPDQRRIVSLILQRETVSSPSIPRHANASVTVPPTGLEGQRSGSATIRRAAVQHAGQRAGMSVL
ncbi:hypothetical protein [Azospirillum melinis]